MIHLRFSARTDFWTIRRKALSERILNAELDEHLDDERAGGSTNRRNGSSKKTVLTGTSRMTLSIPRDRAGTFDPKPIAKYQRRFPDFDHALAYQPQLS